MPDQDLEKAIWGLFDRPTHSAKQRIRFLVSLANILRRRSQNGFVPLSGSSACSSHGIVYNDRSVTIPQDCMRRKEYPIVSVVGFHSDGHTPIPMDTCKSPFSDFDCPVAAICDPDEGWYCRIGPFRSDRSSESMIWIEDGNWIVL